MQIKDKKVLIIGGGSKIASAIAKRLLEQGATIILQYRNHKPIINKVKLLQVDLQEEKDCENLISSYLKLESSGPDIFINCIGDFSYKHFKDLTFQEFKQIIDSNLYIAFNLCKLILPLMKEKKEARILHFGYSGANILEAKPSILPYHISKIGVSLLTKTIAQTYAPNILANCLCLGIAENNDFDFSNKIPLARPVKLEEIAEAVEFLIKSDYITATDFYLDGGFRPTYS